mgnify:CR=1 FL=1
MITIRDEVISLIAVTKEKDKYGIGAKSTETSTEVFADVRSVSLNEFVGAGQLGIRPAFIFKINAYEYDDQSELDYKNERYSIYRTYLRRDFQDDLELYAERKKGVHGK